MFKIWENFKKFQFDDVIMTLKQVHILLWVPLWAKIEYIDGFMQEKRIPVD